MPKVRIEILADMFGNRLQASWRASQKLNHNKRRWRFRQSRKWWQKRGTTATAVFVAKPIPRPVKIILTALKIRFLPFLVNPVEEFSGS